MIQTSSFREYVHSEDFLFRLDLPKGTELSFSLLGQGEYNANFLFQHPKTGQKLVLRVNTGSQMHLDDQIGYEFAALNALEPSGRTPRALFCDNARIILPYGTLVMEWLPGRALRYETDMVQAAEILADIHVLPVPPDCPLIRPEYPLESIYEECLSLVEHYFHCPRAVPAVCRLLTEIVEAVGKKPLRSVTDAPACIVNTELNSGNFLINEQGCSYLVDWEKPLLSEPAQDLGHFLAPTTTFWKTDVILPPEEIGDFVRQYVAAVNGRIDLAALHQRLPLYFSTTCLRGVSWCSMAIVEYLSEERLLSNSDTFAKIQQYLDEDFLRHILATYIYRDFFEE